MTSSYSFERLIVWADARKFVKWIYETTSMFPPEEKFGLVTQLRRASISVVSNLAEGAARISPKDQAHFSQIAYSSLIEVLNQLIISCDLNFITEIKLAEGRILIDAIASKISSLRKTQLNKIISK